HDESVHTGQDARLRLASTSVVRIGLERARQDATDAQVEPAVHQASDTGELGRVDAEARVELVTGLLEERLLSLCDPSGRGGPMDAKARAELVEAPPLEQAKAQQIALARCQAGKRPLQRCANRLAIALAQKAQ